MLDDFFNWLYSKPYLQRFLFLFVINYILLITAFYLLSVYHDQPAYFIDLNYYAYIGSFITTISLIINNKKN